LRNAGKLRIFTVDWSQLENRGLTRNFQDFYQRAAAASKIALDASKAKGPEEFRTLIVQLRDACTGCHALYQKTDP